ncbi:MAG: aminotransferase class I/II-fold pyridoxal phosphate-dependent enzyme [Rhizobacter sp.]|nr:aminotransferase class I/II-fold pyridoxal phosphate-dependent enzyme [Ferruginibacter sp.]
MKSADRLKDINEYYFSQKLRAIDAMNQEGKNVINLGIGSPDLPPHPEVIKVLQEQSARPDTHAYQNYKGSPVLRKAIGDWYNRWYNAELDPESEILPLIGSKEGIMHICMTYLDEGDCALIPDPGYPTYSAAVKLTGAAPLNYDLKATNNWRPDFDVIKIAIDTKNSAGPGKVKLMFVNYPHMPTGQLPDTALFEELVNFAKANDLILVHDNPYSFILNDSPMSLMTVKGAREVALELNSLSKSHNMAGWRIGMMVGAAEKINEVLKFKSNMDSGMFLPLQLAAAHALGLGADWHQSVNAIYKNRRQMVFRLLDLLKCDYNKDQAGMFVWASIPATYADGYQLSDAVLNNANVFLTPGGIFGENGKNYIRISLCCSEESMEQAINRIKEII